MTPEIAVTKQVAASEGFRSLLELVFGVVSVVLATILIIVCCKIYNKQEKHITDLKTELDFERKERQKHYDALKSLEVSYKEELRAISAAFELSMRDISESLKRVHARIDDIVKLSAKN